MYKQDSVRQVLMDFKITITGNKVKRQYNANPFTHINTSWDDPIFYKPEEEHVTMITAEIPEREFTAMADVLCEFRDLMRDPETARLLMEARFINRLKGNR
jgi:hypothetical protein